MRVTRRKEPVVEVLVPTLVLGPPEMGLELVPEPEAVPEIEVPTPEQETEDKILELDAAYDQKRKEMKLFILQCFMDSCPAAKAFPNVKWEIHIVREPKLLSDMTVEIFNLEHTMCFQNEKNIMWREGRNDRPLWIFVGYTPRWDPEDYYDGKRDKWVKTYPLKWQEATNVTDQEQLERYCDYLVTARNKKPKDA